MGKHKFLLGLGMSCLMVLLACSFAFAGGAKVLKIGGLFCLKGLGSEAETYVAQGAQLAVDWINKKGGLTIKGQKYKLKLVVEDVGGTANGASLAANKMAYDHKVKFVVGTVVPFMVIAAGTVLEPAKVLRVALYNCGTPAEYGPKTRYMFVSQDATVEGIAPSLQYLREAYPKVKSITYVIPDDGSVPYLGPLFRKIAKKHGSKVASIAKWAMNTQDSIAFANGWPAATGAMLKVAREMGFKGPVFGCNYDDPAQIAQIAGKKNSYNFFIHSLVLNHPAMTPMIKMMVKMARAIQKAQSLDPTKVRNTWEKMTTIQTIWGPGRMCGRKTYGINHTVCHPIPIAALVKGRVKWVKWIDVFTE
ncbi:MAG: ABC transporter substrate-binding protein [Candidatus Hodarchaeota archaeon]